MLPDYADIRDAADREPLWFDGNGVPRYAPFNPDMLGVYDHLALYVLIKCQSCEQRFYVGEGWSKMRMLWPPRGQDSPDNPVRFLSFEEIANGYHYGDPPRHSCRGAGETMNCVDIRIVEAWSKEDVFEGWVRRPVIEAINIHPDWDD